MQKIKPILMTALIVCATIFVVRKVSFLNNLVFGA